MKFKVSKYGIIAASIFAVYFLFIFLVDPSETGPLGFLWYFSLLFYLPIFILSALLPFELSPAISFIVSVVIFYFIGVGIEKIFNKKL
ncbi:MAG: hypothetical protein CMI53_02670 [Parcubacteria group bacterium]|jgi:hypothetical protein|nr:hypothetical protein [Parcubacteria group bacterium]|tara:strand:- start:469 stop:732 length:264 start_codon:yes stop_codon:yes gene_type:complete